MMFDVDDPFHYVLQQKININNGSNIKKNNNIKLNLNKLPRDFFPQHGDKKSNGYSQRLSESRKKHVNQFLAYNKTV